MNIKKEKLDLPRPANNRLITIIVIGIALIIVAYIVPTSLRTESEKQLATEEAIAGAMNKQNLAVKKLEDDEKAILGEDEYNRLKAKR